MSEQAGAEGLSLDINAVVQRLGMKDLEILQLQSEVQRLTGVNQALQEIVGGANAPGDAAIE
jgi:hypothetical protein